MNNDSKRTNEVIVIPVIFFPRNILFAVSPCYGAGSASLELNWCSHSALPMAEK